jgi:hypothetical protein
MVRSAGQSVNLGLAATLVAVASCSSGGLKPGDGGDASAVDGSVEVRVACPATMPIQGDACQAPWTVCEYGDDPNRFCRTYSQCDRTWANNVATMQDCPSAISTSCPASSAVAAGTDCAEMGAWCRWPAGTACQCTNCRPSPQGRVCDGAPKWQCLRALTPEIGCPQEMPRAGTVCTIGPFTCDYGCLFGARRCLDGVWIPYAGFCPMSRRDVKQEIHHLTQPEIDAVAARAWEL